MASHTPMRSWIEISRKALLHNIGITRKKLTHGVKLFAVVKSNAYGHDMELVARAISSRVDAFCVANTEEAIALRSTQHKKRIIVLSYFTTLEPKHLALLEKEGIEVPVADHTTLRALCSSTRKLKIHLKVDTGTTRIGFLPHEMSSVLTQIKHSSLTVSGVFSHFSNVEETSDAFYRTQLDRFSAVVAKVKTIAPQCDTHISCSAGIYRSKDTHHTAVRLGIHLYGLTGLTGKTNLSKELKPVLSWKAKIIQIKSVPKGTSIGYNKTYTTKQQTRIATLPVGYWDGYPRSLSNTGVISYGKHTFPVRGTICMNLMMVEIPKYIRIQEGSIVHVFGGTADVSTLARKAHTIHYELIARINPSIPRYLS